MGYCRENPPIKGDEDEIKGHLASGSPALRFVVKILTVQFSSVAQSCPTLCDPMNCSTPGFLVHHQLPEPIQTHVH